MPKFRFNKLVRDKIPEQQIASGAKPVTRILSPEEKWSEYALKGQEEFKELGSAQGDERLEELADVQQLVDDALAVIGRTKEDLHTVQTAKAAKVGTFAAGTYIESVEIAETDPWIDHFRNNPDRYPEID